MSGDPERVSLSSNVLFPEMTSESMFVAGPMPSRPPPDTNPSTRLIGEPISFTWQTPPAPIEKLKPGSPTIIEAPKSTVAAAATVTPSTRNSKVPPAPVAMLPLPRKSIASEKSCSAWPGSDPLAYLRGRIDAVDDELASLVARRVALTAAMPPFSLISPMRRRIRSSRTGWL